MQRYFLEVSYKGTNYSGFQAQQNAHTVQAEVEGAFTTLQREKVILTGSSRTDAGVHALQNFFHFDYEGAIDAQFVYKMNAILPADVVIRGIYPVKPDAHCRFHALSRAYRYVIYRRKDPFLNDRAFYFPYKLDMERMQEAAELVLTYTNFQAFSKTNTQVKNFNCAIIKSSWSVDGDLLNYNVEANRFLRGMVRALTATMLLVGRGKITVAGFRNIIEGGDNGRARFGVPAHGLFLLAVKYDEAIMGEP